MVHPTAEWGQAVARVIGEKARPWTRYATDQKKARFDKDKLVEFASRLPADCELRPIDKELYGRILTLPWAWDLCGNIPGGWDGFAKNGLGFVILHGGEPVSGASSYAYWRGGIEVEIDTRPDYQRRGLATICGAALILECLRRGLYPNWDAHTKESLALAEKLGYALARAYPVYLVSRRGGFWLQDRDLLQQFPPELQRLLAGCRFFRDTLGCSNSVVLHVPEKKGYLKIAAYNPVEPLATEAAVLRWLQGKLPVPEVQYYERWQDTEYLLISEIKGTVCSDEVHRGDPETMVHILAEGLRLIHGVEAAGCPFDQSLAVKLEKARRNVELGLVDEADFENEHLGMEAQELYELALARRPAHEDLVFTHGDYCLPNIILRDGRLSGFIDWGRAGVADRYQDIALAVRSLWHNHYGEEWVTLLLDTYGVKDPDWEKIHFYILLDEFF